MVSSTRRVSAVRFFDGARRIAVDRRGVVGLYTAVWRARRVRRGRHVLRAVVVTRGGGRTVASRRVRVCR
jgi:hypothetical protein